MNAPTRVESPYPEASVAVCGSQWQPVACGYPPMRARFSCADL